MDVVKHSDFEWNFEVGTLPNARGLDGEPIFTHSPQVTLMAEGEWRLDLTYAPLGGEQEEISEQTFGQGIAEPFPSDLYEDPWVGRYKVSLLHEGELVDVRFISLAEGLHMRFNNEGPRGTDFRFIDALGKHSPFSYTLASPPKKPIALEKGMRTFGESETSRREVVASDAGYELEFDVMPEALYSRVKLIGLEPTLHSDKPTILAGQLDQDGMFSVHSPRPLPLAKFVTIDGRQKIKELARTSRTTQALRTLSVPNAALVGAVRKQPTSELFLMWSTMTYEDYLAGLSPEERSAHESRNLERRVMEYEASASTSLIYAALATVRKSPLAGRGQILGKSIDIEQNLEEPVDLLGWAWPLDHPTMEATPLEPIEGGFAFPEELREEGPLLVDAREHQASSNLAAPARPSSASIVVSPADAQPALASPEWSALELWKAFRALHVLSQRSPNPKLQAMFDSVIDQLRRHPETALDALGSSGVSVNQQARSLARTRLFHTPLGGGEAEGIAASAESYPQLLLNPTASPNQELATTASTGADHLTRPMLLAAATMQSPTPAVEDLMSENARIVALRECFANNGPLDALGTVEKLRKDATALASLVQNAGVDMSVNHTLIALGAFASGNTADELHVAAWLPYISYAFALASRAAANDLIMETPLLKEDMPMLADVMPLAPRLFFYDLVTAETLFRER
ncbi:hypothetical protein [Corynebacterium sp.]|uniref:hypothetical protein n=1 Tax=Corynebacterium sp. TaxID=1720 RepID=UPI0026DC28A9|nr:hypothetical protein [Corynebacterium sp.]MDO5032659.1 hypothetical protein [Corynebacterium sp.]